MTNNSTENPPRYFGTDGIRGPANIGKMAPDSIIRLAQAAAQYFTKTSKADASRPSVFIGKDTRLSGDMIEASLIAGFTSVGMNVLLSDPLPTAGVSILTRDLDADMGVMITASHNKFQDNGLKFFGPDGRKLSDVAERDIETLLASETSALVKPDAMGCVEHVSDTQSRYIEIAKASFPPDINLSGVKIVIDCANGAAYQTAPKIFEGLGAESVVSIGVCPDGKNINAECGSTHTALLTKTVLETGADVGIALDGDADRLIMCDETGKVVDGDQLLGLIATGWRAAGKLSKPGLVVTVMSNLGLERFVKAQDMQFIRTAVGDRHVAAYMQAEGYNVGGEQSGHILMPDLSPTGDGTMAGLQVLAEIIRAGKPASEVLNVFNPVPQMLKNVKYSGRSPLDSDRVKAAIKAAEQELGSDGRVLVRASGTEPLIRVMAEGDNESIVDRVTDDILNAIKTAASP